MLPLSPVILKNGCTNHTSTGTPSSSETTVEKKKTNKRKETKEKFKNVQSSCMSVPYNPPRASYGLIHTLLGGADTVFLPLQREDAPGQTYSGRDN